MQRDGFVLVVHQEELVLPAGTVTLRNGLLAATAAAVIVLQFVVLEQQAVFETVRHPLRHDSSVTIQRAVERSFQGLGWG